MKRFLCIFLCVSGCDAAADYTGPRSGLDDTAALAARQACMFKAGDPVGISVAKDAKLGSQIPVDTIIVTMMENRSFDHLLSNLPAYGQSDVDVATSANSNPDSQGQPVAFHHQQAMCFSDTDHEWSGAHQEYDSGKNDGFVTANDNYSGGPAIGERAMGFYTDADVPFIYAAANAFAISDRYFCSALGPTLVNREFLYAGSSFGYTYNAVLPNPENNVFELLEAKKVNWAVYSETVPGAGEFLDTYSRYISENFFPLSQFFTDAAAGKLPPVVFVDPNLRNDGAIRDDFHPPGDVQLGDQFIAKITAATTSSPQWPHAALILTFDENGGLFDHVPPPPACPPDDIAPILQSGDTTMAGFDRLGFRVPVIVVSPYAKPHYVSHHVYDHTSILRFIEARFELAALTGRDANAEPLFDLFDFTTAALKNPPSLPAPTPDQTQLDSCTTQFPKSDGGIPGGI